ncbi:MAG: hypothetical protein GSR79_00120 [Desulfurococcales archaeon]|nr:hypothetical protein [Desulfurococcales archaeon]
MGSFTVTDPGTYYGRYLLATHTEVGTIITDQSYWWQAFTVTQFTFTLTVRVHNADGMSLPDAGGTLTVELYDSSGSKVGQGPI